MQSFLSVLHYYRCFVYRYAALVSLSTDLKRNIKKILFPLEAEATFAVSKRALLSYIN